MPTRRALRQGLDSHGWPPCWFEIGTTTDPQFVERLDQPLDNRALGDPLTQRSLLDELPLRTTLPIWQHPDAPPCMCGSPPLTEARPSRTAPGGCWTAWLDGRGDLPRRGHQWHQGARWATWAGCLAQGGCPDTSTPSGRMLFGMLGVFSEFERAMIRDRVLAGLDRARSSGKCLGRPRTTPFQVQRIRLALDEGRGVRETARLLKVSAAKVSEVRRMSATAIGLPLTSRHRSRASEESVLRTQSPS